MNRVFDAVAARALVGDDITSGRKKEAANHQAISRRMHLNDRVWRPHSGRWGQGSPFCGNGLHGEDAIPSTCEEPADLAPESRIPTSTKPIPEIRDRFSRSTTRAVYAADAVFRMLWTCTCSLGCVSCDKPFNTQLKPSQA